MESRKKVLMILFAGQQRRYRHKEQKFGHSKRQRWRRQWHPTPVLLPGESHGQRSPGAKSQARLSEFTFTFHCHALEKETATHSSIHAWKIPWIEEPGGLQSMGSQRVGHDWVTELNWTDPILVFFFWLTSLCIIGCRFIHLIRTVSNVFLLIADCVYIPQTPYPLIRWWTSSCF